MPRDGERGVQNNAKCKINSERKLPFANALAAMLDDVNNSANSE